MSSAVTMPDHCDVSVFHLSLETMGSGDTDNISLHI